MYPYFISFRSFFRTFPHQCVCIVSTSVNPIHMNGRTDQQLLLLFFFVQVAPLEEKLKDATKISVSTKLCFPQAFPLTSTHLK